MQRKEGDAPKEVSISIDSSDFIARGGTSVPVHDEMSVNFLQLSNSQIDLFSSTPKQSTGREKPWVQTSYFFFFSKLQSMPHIHSVDDQWSLIAKFWQLRLPSLILCGRKLSKKSQNVKFCTVQWGESGMFSTSKSSGCSEPICINFILFSQSWRVFSNVKNSKN